jgi:type IV pilus assembly protein PilV
MRKQQSGIMLIEALIAILIFSIGILGVVGIQASAIAASRDAKFRTDAGLLANELIGQMWSGNRDGVVLQTNFQGDGNQAGATNVLLDGAIYSAWLQRVTDTLPGVLENPPQVSVTPGVIGPPKTSSVVDIKVRWKSATESVAHSYRVIVNII